MPSVSLVKKDPDKAYINNMLWLPKSGVSEASVKAALEKWIVVRGKPQYRRMYMETTTHLVVPRRYLDPSMYPSLRFPVVDLRPKSYAPVTFRFKREESFRDDRQEEAMRALLAADGGIFNLGTGRGKGQPASARALTPTGWAPFGSLRVGDQVIGSAGTPVRVTGVFNRGKLPVFRVSFSDTTDLIVDGDHLWRLRAARHSGDRHYFEEAVLSTSALANDLIGQGGRSKWRLPLVAPIQFTGGIDLPIHPYVLGVLLGDGHLSAQPNAFTPGDTRVPDIVRGLLPSGLTLTQRAYPDRAVTYSIVDGKGPGGGRRNPVLSAMRSLGLSQISSEERFIPDIYLFSSPDSRLSVLQGLLDTDGEFIPNTSGIRFASASKRLRDEVCFLVQSLGGIARKSCKKDVFYYYKGQKLRGKPSFMARICLPPGVEPTRAHPDRFVPRGKYKTPARFVRSVEPAGEDDVICISVDAPDQMYVTENCIVTHNTTCTHFKMGAKGGPCLIVVHNSSVLSLWQESLLNFLCLEKKDIGIIKGEKFEWEKPVVIAMIQTLSRRAEAEELPPGFDKRYSLTVFDEVHHLPGEQFVRTAPLSYGERVGLTATVDMRDDGLDYIYMLHLGKVIHKDTAVDLKPMGYFYTSDIKPLSDADRKSCTRGGVFNEQGEKEDGDLNRGLLWGLMSKREDFLAQREKHLKSLLARGRKVMALSMSVEILEALHKRFPGSVLITGDSVKNYEDRNPLLYGSRLAFVTTSLGVESINDIALDTLVALTPFSSKIWFHQGVGRVGRLNKADPAKAPEFHIIEDRAIGELIGTCRTMKHHFQQSGYHYAVKNISNL